MHVNNLQRSVNNMEELVEITARRDGIYRSLFERQVTEFPAITAAE